MMIMSACSNSLLHHIQYWSAQMAAAAKGDGICDIWNSCNYKVDLLLCKPQFVLIWISELHPPFNTGVNVIHVCLSALLP